MKKILALATALVLVLSLAGTAFAEIDPANYTYFEDPITLTASKNDTFAFHGYDDEWVDSTNNKWYDVIKEVLNVDFSYKWVTESDDESYHTKWNLALASGDIPNFGAVNRVTYEALVEANLVADMTDYYEQYASETVKSLVEGSPEQAYMTRDGRLIGYPDVRPSMDSYDVIVVRKDWMEKVGVTEIPTTIEGIIDLGKKFVDAKLGGENTYALCVGEARAASTWGGLQGFFQGHGIPYADGYWMEDEETGELYYGPTDERMKDALLTLQDLYAQGLIKEDYLVTDAKESFVAGECGIIYSVCFGPVNAVDLYAVDEEVDLIAADVPTLTGNKPDYYVNAVPGRFFFVHKDAPDIEKQAFVETLNLMQDLFSDFDYDWGYHRGTNPFAPGDQMESAFQYALYYAEIEHAYTTGDLDSFLTANAKTYYTRLVDYENGDRSLGKYHGIYRVPEGTYNIIYDAMEDDRVHNSYYTAPPTENIQEYQAMLDTVLMDAVNQVIMGADISVWEKAVEEWHVTGGQDMLDDVNEWYAEHKD